MNGRTPLIAGNWKMHTTAATGLELCRALRDSIDAIAGVDTAVCPPFPFLEQTRTVLAGSTIAVGAQDLHWEEQGAFTGQVSPLMLLGLVEYVIIGHSERRQHFGETNETVNRKLTAALRHDLIPILCVGETQEEREAGRTEQLLKGQLRQGLDSVPWTPACVLAYEPVWAIGTGLAATAEQANETIGFLRSLLAELTGSDVAASTRIQYGGSVKPDNAVELFSQPEIDGALVGGASLDADAFTAIVRAAAETKT